MSGGEDQMSLPLVGVKQLCKHEMLCTIMSTHFVPPRNLIRCSF